MKSICPCCRAPVSGPELYRYPARTSLRSAFLRRRLDRRLNWRDPALQISHWDGMTDFVRAFIDAPAQPLTSVLEVQISGSPSVGFQVDEVSRAPVESFEAEPKLGVECTPGGSSSKRPASLSPERTECAEPKLGVECRPGGSSSKRPATLSPERTARDSDAKRDSKRERHSVHPPLVAEEMETDSEMEEA